MFIPYWVDVPYDRRPYGNWFILLLIVLVFCAQIAVIVNYNMQLSLRQGQAEQEQDSMPVSSEQSDVEQQAIKIPLSEWILHGWDVQGLLGHMWMHGGILHLAGNMLFLWLFGNAVCAKVGNKLFILFYFAFGFIAAATHLIFNGAPMLGASGAINGVVGMFLVFFPENEISCVWFFFPFIRKFSISSYWMILMWFVFDIWGAVTSGDNVAYFAHVGGFASGFVLAVFMLERKWVTMEYYEKSLLQLVGIHKKESMFDKEYFDPNFAFLQEQAQQAAATAADNNVSAQLKLPDLSPPPVEQAADTETTTVTQPKLEAPPEFIKVLCSCGKKVKFPAKYAGRTGKCPQCGGAILIPDASQNIDAVSRVQNAGQDGMIQFSCRCGRKIKVSGKYSGKTARCPQCQGRVVIP